MFASNMKILTLNTNNTSPIAASGGVETQPLIKVFNNTDNRAVEGARVASNTSGPSYKSNKREQKFNTKSKFINGSNSGKMQQHTTQQQQQQQQQQSTQKYNHKNNNNNGTKSKTQHYSNSSNNNLNSSLNRKKYYQHYQQQQPQQQQQKHYHKQHPQQQQQYTTAMPKAISCSQTTTNNNNNSNLIKNQNYNDIDSHTQKQQQHHNTKNIASNSTDYSTNVMETCTCIPQQAICDKLSLSSFPPGTFPSPASSLTTSTDYQRLNQQSLSVSHDNSIKDSLTSTTKTSSCRVCWSDFQKNQLHSSATSLNLKSTRSLDNLQEFVPSAAVSTASSLCDTNKISTRTTSLSSSQSSSTNSSTTASCSQSSNASNSLTTSSVSKKKSFRKYSNTNACDAVTVNGGGSNITLSSTEYSSGRATQSKLSKEEDHHVSDKNITSNSSRNLSKNHNNNGNEQKYINTLAADINTAQQGKIAKHSNPNTGKIAMTTSLATSISSASVTSVISNNKVNAASSASKTCTSSPKLEQETLEKLNDSSQLLQNLPNRSHNKSETTTTTSSSTITTAVTSTQNSYTLDFLHLVGAKMTGVSTAKQGSTNVYGNQSTTQTPVHNSCSYTTVTTTQRQPRYMYGGSNVSSGNGSSQQQYYHHHQPSQLTIASFINKDLLGTDNGGVAKANSSGNSGGNSSSSTNIRKTNNYDDKQHQHHYTQQQPATHSRYHNYYDSSYQHQSRLMQQNSNYGDERAYGKELGRVVTNGGSGQRNSGCSYTNYQNTGGESIAKIGKNNVMGLQQHPRQLKNNTGNYKNSVNNSQGNKKSSYASSITSTCSSSSSKSISSNPSNVSTRQIKTATNQDINNLAIETLPPKVLGGANQRSNHRGHHNHHSHHYNNQHILINSPNVWQHQNYYNLTYVNTDGTGGNSTTSDGSPATQPIQLATSSHSTKGLDNNPVHVAPLVNFNPSHLQYPRYQHTPHFHQLQMRQQQPNFLNKKVILPLTLNMKSPSPSPTSLAHTAGISINSQQAQPPIQNIISCSQLDAVTTAAAADAATSIIMSGSDCDSEALGHSSTKIKYSLKSSPVCSSASANSTCLSTATNQDAQHQTSKQVTLATSCGSITPLHVPLDYNYNFANLQLAQQLQLSPVFNSNSGTVVSLLNLPPAATQKVYAEEDYHRQQQQQQHQHHHHQQHQHQHHQLYFNANVNQVSSDHLNIASSLTAVSNYSANSSGYWSPSYHSNQFLYHPTPSTQVSLMPATTSSSSSCGSSSASISPRLQNDDLQQQTQQVMHNNIASVSQSSSPSISLNEQFSSVTIGNSSNADSGMSLAGSPCSSHSSTTSSCSNNGSRFSINSANEEQNSKTGSAQLLAKQQRSIVQQTYQYSSSSSSSSASTLTAALRTSDRGGYKIGVNTSNGCNNQLPQLPQTSITSSVGTSVSGCGMPQLSPAPAQHVYTPHQQLHQSLPPPIPSHNLLYSNHQAMRPVLGNSSGNESISNNTPIDRFLAKVQLYEAKEPPSTLLNNTKWDRLSQEIWKKFTNAHQTPATFKQKMRLWRSLYLFVKNTYPRYGLYLVGSTISGFGSDSSDVDMCLVSRSVSNIDPRMEALYNLTILKDDLRKQGEYDNFNLIEAKVPILRFNDCNHQFEIDLNFNNCVGIKNTHLLYCYSQLDWRLRPLVLITKLWAQYHNINNAKNMTISSYSLVLMVIHFLQYAVNPPVLPCLHEIFPDKFTLLRSNDFGYVDMSETMGPYDSKNTQTIGELFLLFLEYYSFFDYTQYAISVRTGGLLPINVCRVAKSIKNDIHQWKELCIEEPFDLTNTARSVYDYETFERVKAVFVASWQILQETLDLNSVFTTLLIPSPCPSENFNTLANINQKSITPVFNGTNANVPVGHSTINYVNNCDPLTIDGGNYEEHCKSSIGRGNGNNIDDDNTDKIDDDATATNNPLTNSSRQLPNCTDLNRTLTPRQNNLFGEKDFPCSPASSFSLNYIKAATKNVNRSNNNSKIVPATIMP